MRNITIAEAEGHLAELAELAMNGEEIRITRSDGKVFKLIVEGLERKGRVAGLHAGQGWVSDEFDEPLDDDFWMGESKKK
ncbi:MAG: hypothetical protein KUG82_22990 [Pseudomonadales bacterium]|nr:hypothetical protein [Pseudomonadales bacterium]